MALEKEVVMAMVKKGDMVQITPYSNVPNAQRKFKVDAILSSGYLYGCSSNCDGYVIPFNWIKAIRIIKSA